MVYFLIEPIVADLCHYKLIGRPGSENKIGGEGVDGVGEG